jgi:hypothetical protein
MAYQTVAAPQSKRRFPRFRKATWVLIIFNVLMLIWVISGIASVGGGSCNGLDQATCNAAKDIGGGIGVALLIVLWFIGFVVLGLVWLMSKPKNRQCPRCGHDVKKGLMICKSCNFDFAQATAQVPTPPPVLG